MKNSILLLLATILSMGLFAQQSINSSGGDATGSGSASYSVGQVSYTAINDVSGASLIQGVQIPFEFFATYGSLSGNVPGLAGCSEREMNLAIYNLNQTFNRLLVVTIDSNGDYIAPEIPIGTYDIYATIQGYLTKRYTDVLIESGVNELDVSGIIAGDLNNSNSVNIQDISILSLSFGVAEGSANYNFLADFNCDGSVNILDISVMGISFGLQGDIAP